MFVARTFSKAYGMAGMRIGYAIGMPDTMKKLAALKMPYNISVFGVAAALASLGDPKHIENERKRNTEVRAFTVKALLDMGARPADSQGNFLFVDVGRPAAEFRDACAKQGRHGRARFPALREKPLPHLDRDDGRDEEGGPPSSAPRSSRRRPPRPARRAGGKPC